jgi:hypothetical protein
MSRLAPRTRPQAAWQSVSPNHIRLAESVITLAVIGYFASVLLSHLLKL